MSQFVLDVVVWILGIRGHIPQIDGFRTGRADAALAAGTGVRVLAAAFISVAVLSLALWTAVWLAIKVL